MKIHGNILNFFHQYYFHFIRRNIFLTNSILHTNSINEEKYMKHKNMVDKNIIKLSCSKTIVTHRNENIQINLLYIQ
jgi:hypothetical protein